MATSWLALPLMVNFMLSAMVEVAVVIFVGGILVLHLRSEENRKAFVPAIIGMLFVLFIPFLHYAIPAWHSPSLVGGNASCTPAGVAALLSIPVNVTHRVREIPFPSFCHTDEVELLGYGNATAGKKCCAPAIRGSFTCSGFSLVPNPVFALEIVEDSATRDSYVSCCPRFGPTDGIGMTPPGFASMGLSAIVGVVVNLLLNGLGMAWVVVSAKYRRKCSADTPDETEVIVLDGTTDDCAATTTNTSGSARFPAYIDVNDVGGLCHALSKTNRYLLARCAGTIVHIEQIVKDDGSASTEPLHRLCSIDLKREEGGTCNKLPISAPVDAPEEDTGVTEQRNEEPPPATTVVANDSQEATRAVVACCFSNEDTLLFALVCGVDGFFECNLTTQQVKHIKDDAPPKLGSKKITDKARPIKHTIHASDDGLIVLYSLPSFRAAKLFQRATSNDALALVRTFDDCRAIAMTSTGSAIVCSKVDGTVVLYRKGPTDSGWEEGDVGGTMETIRSSSRAGRTVSISDDATLVTVDETDILMFGGGGNWGSVLVDTVTKQVIVFAMGEGFNVLAVNEGFSSISRDGGLVVVRCNTDSDIFRVRRTPAGALTTVRLAQLSGSSAPSECHSSFSAGDQLLLSSAMTTTRKDRGDGATRGQIWNIDGGAFETLRNDNELTYNGFVADLFRYSTITVVKSALGVCVGFVLAVRGANAAATQGITGWGRYDAFALAVLNSAIVSNFVDLFSTTAVFFFFRPADVFHTVVIDDTATSEPCCPHAVQRVAWFCDRALLLLGASALVWLGLCPLLPLFWTHWFSGMELFAPTIAPLLFPFVIAVPVPKLVVDLRLEKNYQQYGMPLQLARAISLLCCLAIGVCINMVMTIAVRFPVNMMLIFNGNSPYPYLGDAAKQSASSLYTGLYDVIFYLLQMSSNTCASLASAQSAARSMDYYQNVI